MIIYHKQISLIFSSSFCGFWNIFYLGYKPVLKNPQASRSHTVDTPVGDAVLVADAHGEPAVVGPHDLDHGPWGAREVQRVALTRVRCLHFVQTTSFNCNKNNNGNFKFSTSLGAKQKLIFMFSLYSRWTSLVECIVSFYGNFYEFFTCTPAIIWHAS